MTEDTKPEKVTLEELMVNNRRRVQSPIERGADELPSRAQTLTLTRFKYLPP
jgi:hypothetical protein